MKFNRFHRVQITMRVIDMIEDRMLTLETMDEKTYFFYPDREPKLFKFEFEAASWQEARTKAKLLYWMWHIYNNKTELGLNEFLAERLEV